MTRVAVAQVEPVFGDINGNIALSLEYLERAQAGGAEIVVLPELVSTGYVFESRSEADSLAELAGVGPATTAWLAAAQDFGMIVVAGFCERAGTALFNSAFLALPDGSWTVYRKVHLWDAEALYFEPGDLGFPVVRTPHGRIGMLICYDGWFAESYRALALGGAELVCVPTNWVPIPGQRDDAPAMATLLAQASAHSNGLIVACADRVGSERTGEFIGQSVIVSHTGWPVAGPASADRSELLIADVDLQQARRSRSWGEFNHVLRDRRPEVYAR